MLSIDAPSSSNEKHQPLKATVFPFDDPKISAVPPPDKIAQDYQEKFQESGTAIIIDNGSFGCRVGWGSEDTPRLSFRSVTGRFRHRSAADAHFGTGTLVGNDIHPSMYAKVNARPPFDRNIVYNFEIMEQILDHAFLCLGINEHADRINHPILMTEAVCNPNYCRKKMSELMFECYRVPSVVYGVDSLFSYYKYMYSNINNNDNNDGTGLIISSGFSSTYILPVVQHAFKAEHCKRISIGGFHATDLLLKLLQLKYRQHRGLLSVYKTQQIKENHTYVASPNYIEELRKFQTIRNYNKHALQLPFVPAPTPQPVELDPEAQAQAEREKAEKEARRKELIQKMKQSAAQRREEMLVEQQQQLAELLEMRKIRATDEKLFMQYLRDYEYESIADFEATIEFLEKKLKKKNAEEKSKENEQLLEMPDEELTEEQRRKKRQLKSIRAASEARKKKKAEQEAEMAIKAQQQKEEEEKKLEDPAKYLMELQKKRQHLLERISRKKKYKSELRDRKSAASQQRLKALASAADEDENPEEDTFGMDDDDWSIYKIMAGEAIDDDGVDYEKELAEIEDKISQIQAEVSKRKAASAVNEPFAAEEEEGEEARHQIQLSVERIQVPEIVFQPSIIGMDQAGITETLSYVLNSFPAATQTELCKNVFLYGGNTLYPQFADRIQAELTAMRPYGSTIRVRRSESVLDAWSGASLFWRQNRGGPAWQKRVITLEEYEERGADNLFEVHESVLRKFNNFSFM